MFPELLHSPSLPSASPHHPVLSHSPSSKKTRLPAHLPLPLPKHSPAECPYHLLLCLLSLARLRAPVGGTRLIFNCLEFIALGTTQVSVNTLELIQMWMLKMGQLSSWGRMGSKQPSVYTSPPMGLRDMRRAGGDQAWGGGKAIWG